MRTKYRIRATFTVFLLLVGLATPVAAESTECLGEIEATLETEDRQPDKVRLHFTVEVVTETPCAHVTYDLIIREMLPNLQWKSVRKTGRLKVHHGKGSDKVKHEMSPNLRIMGHSAEIVECDSCSKEKS